MAAKLHNYFVVESIEGESVTTVHLTRVFLGGSWLDKSVQFFCGSGARGPVWDKREARAVNLVGLGSRQLQQLLHRLCRAERARAGA